MSNRMRSTLMFSALMLAAGSLSAQQTAFDAAVTPSAVVAPVATTAPTTPAATELAGPRATSSRLGELVKANAAEPAAPKKGEVGAGSNVALMAVGAAAVLIGLLIGGDSGSFVAIGGGVLGLYGLFRYMR